MERIIPTTFASKERWSRHHRSHRHGFASSGASPNASDRLSTIPEEDESAPVYWVSPDLWKTLTQEQRHFFYDVDLDDCGPIASGDEVVHSRPILPRASDHQSDREVLPLHHYHAVGADTGEAFAPEVDHDGNPYVDIMFPEEQAKLILGAPPPEGYTARLRFYLNNPVKRAVVERDTDDLTPEEYDIHHDAVVAAAHEELLI